MPDSPPLPGTTPPPQDRPAARAPFPRSGLPQSLLGPDLSVVDVDAALAALLGVPREGRLGSDAGHPVAAGVDLDQVLGRLR